VACYCESIQLSSFVINWGNFVDRWAAVTFARISPLCEFFNTFSICRTFQISFCISHCTSLYALISPSFSVACGHKHYSRPILRSVCQYHLLPKLLKILEVVSDETYVTIYDHKTWKGLSSRWLSLYLMEINDHKTNQLLTFLLVRVIWTPLLHPAGVRLMKELSALVSLAQTEPSVCRLYSRICM
jgi:hypothetical protein